MYDIRFLLLFLLTANFYQYFNNNNQSLKNSSIRNVIKIGRTGTIFFLSSKQSSFSHIIFILYIYIIRILLYWC